MLCTLCLFLISISEYCDRCPPVLLDRSYPHTSPFLIFNFKYFSFVSEGVLYAHLSVLSVNLSFLLCVDLYLPFVLIVISPLC